MAEIRPEEQSEKAGSCQENLWNEYNLKGHKTGEAELEGEERVGSTGGWEGGGRDRCS